MAWQSVPFPEWRGFHFGVGHGLESLIVLGGDSIVEMHPLFREEDDGSIPISPLQLEINEINVDLAMRLNELWHSVLPKTEKGNMLRNKRSVFFAAHYKNRYYAAAMWTTPVAANRINDGFKWLELRRFAISENAPKNTASRMLKIMRILIIKKYADVIGLLSYQAEEHHDGIIYKAAGWKVSGKSKATIWHKGKKRNEMQTTSDKIRWEYLL